MKKLSLICLAMVSGLISFGADLMVTSMTQPMNGCQLSSSQNISVTIWNSAGGTHAGVFTVNYILNNGPVVTASNNTPIASTAIYNFTFPVPADFSACQIHDLVIWVDGSNDPNHSNDTLWTTRISDCPPTLGSITGPSIMCENINDDTVHISGHNGPIISWDSSPNGVVWTTYPTTNDFHHFTGLPSSTIWRVIMDSPYGICGPDTTSWFTITADQESDAGTLPADFDICDNGNAGFINTTGYVGSVVDWNLSTNFGGGWIPMSNPMDTLWYNNLQNTTQFQVIVKNGVCPADTSAMINLTLIQGTVAGTISGPSFVCNHENDDSLVACCGNGDVISWSVSSDGGVSWQPTTETDSVFNFSGLTSDTWFQATWQFGSCPTEKDSFELTVLPVLVNITPDTTILEGDIINLNACCGASYLWWPDQFIDDVTSETPIINPDVDITYFVKITSVEGCKDTAKIVVTVNPDLTTLLIPNLITPNGDGYNDFWEIGNIESYTENELTIFNIYGQVIYQAAPYNNEWSGTFQGAQLPNGTYMYILELNEEGFEEPIQGMITLTGKEE